MSGIADSFNGHIDEFRIAHVHHALGRRRAQAYRPPRDRGRILSLRVLREGKLMDLQATVAGQPEDKAPPR